MGALVSAIQKLLGGGMGGGSMGSALGGMMGGSSGGDGGGIGGMMGGGGEGSQPSMGSLMGSIGGSGASTAASDHAMGLSAGPDGRHYKDMSQPANSMSLLAQLQQMQSPGQVKAQPMQNNALIQQMLMRARGG